MKEYAFELKLWAYLRLDADSEAEARDRLKAELGTPKDCIVIGSSGGKRFLCFGSVSIEEDDADIELIDIEGQPVQHRSRAR